jgi:phosphoenolpyruvate synthase/pyruvate phosphate dikinase
MEAARLTLSFDQIRLGDIAEVGGKNASLGELFNALKPLGVGVLDGFATTAEAFRRLLAHEGLADRLQPILSGFDPEDVSELAVRGQRARQAVLETPLPDDLRTALLAAYDGLRSRLGREPELAVRSSATAEDLPEASFAGAHETFLNVRGPEELLRAVQACYSSLFTDRAISYRARQGFDQLGVALSVGVQPMVRRVLETMASHGLRQGEDGLEVYAMCELPANVALAAGFLSIFDGYSIGSNDLTQLVLGIDRDSSTVAHLFDERNDAVKAMIASAIDAAVRARKKIGICGQAPSDYPEFATWLVEQGIDSISLNPDAAVKTALLVASVEARLAAAPGGGRMRSNR